jgi:hypothetical protein
MKFSDVLHETTFWTHGGGKKTIHDPNRNKFVSKTDDMKDYLNSLKTKKSYFVKVKKIKTKI